MSVEEAERLAQQEKVSGILECRYKAALSRAAAAAAAKHEKLVAKQTKLAVNAARRVEYLKEWNNRMTVQRRPKQGRRWRRRRLLLLRNCCLSCLAARPNFTPAAHP